MHSGDSGLESREQNVVVELVNKCDYASEIRIHNLLYLAEIERIDLILSDGGFSDNRENWDRLLDVDFKCYFDGAYSEEIQMVLEELCMEEKLNTKKRIINEQKHTIYSTDIGEVVLSTDDKDLIESVCEIYNDFGVDELEKLVKRSWLFKDTEFGETLDFEEYIDHYS